MVGGGLVHRLAVLGAVRRHKRDLARPSPEHRRDLASVIGGIVGQHASHDLADIGIYGKVQLAPGSAHSAVPLLIPLAMAEQLQPMLSMTKCIGLFRTTLG
jgi:hypothetical protein